MQDAQGLRLTAASADAVAAYDHAVAGYLGYRADTGARMQAALAVGGDAPLPHVFSGSMLMLAHSAALLPAARDALSRAEAGVAGATARERAHVGALAAWIGGDLDRALATWEGVLAEHPRDILAFRLHHFCAFWLGRADTMLRAAEAVLPQWDAGVPGYGAVLACRAFAAEECGQYTVAEASGRAAVALDPGDLWAAHAVAHVLEMQGRRGEGLAWIDGLARHWDGANNLAHHLWWHAALYRLERREWDAVLALYDGRFRDRASALTQAMPDLYIDVQNAASMLFRLGLQGVPVGDRWEELADHAEARIGDCLSAFTLPHWMMALAAAGRFAAAERLLATMRDFARANHGTLAPIVGGGALPAARAVLHFHRGEFAAAVAALRPALGALQQLGGSHAQQEVLEQLFLHSAMRAGLHDDARLLLERVAGRHPVPPERRVGYAAAARTIAH